MYQPSENVLDKYANLLVNFALNSGKGVKKGEVVQCAVDDVAKPMLIALYKAILKSGAHPMIRMMPSGTDKIFYKLADDKQLVFFPRDYIKARCSLIDHQIAIISDVDPHELKDIDPKKIFKSMESRKEAREWLNEKENRGKFTWTLALYGTEAMAKEANMTLKQYWKTIIEACYLDKPNPIAEWKRIQNEQERIKQKLNALKIEHVNIKGKNIDLNIKLGKERKWLGGSGRNIPSYELFISPDWRGTEGYVYFNQPLYRYGNLVKGVRLEFKNGKVIKAAAAQGKKLIDAMLEQKNADRLGEFSLTDKRFSRIKQFTANTLFDENLGGKYGNTHMALGMSYKDSYTGDPSKPTKKEWEQMGFNDSAEHTDIISTENRVVTAHLSDGSSRVIYKGGIFMV